ncbi:hypothetical protein Plhal304r1_c020g0071001 [Plasmopara halstedii]
MPTGDTSSTGCLPRLDNVRPFNESYLPKSSIFESYTEIHACVIWIYSLELIHANLLGCNF